MVYVKQSWSNRPSTSSPISAARLLHIEQGIFDATTAFNVLGYGAVGDGVADDTDAINTALDAAAGGTLTFPAGTYKTGAWSVPDGTNIVGMPGAIVDLGSTSELITFDGAGISVTGLKFVSDDRDQVVLHAEDGAENIVLTNIECVEARLLITNDGLSYGSANSGNSVKNIVVRNVRATATSASDTNALIELRYVDTAQIDGVRASGYYHGVMWWGGDSNHAANGAVSNARKATDITISNCVLDDIELGGIWGSMGERITITGNVTTNCGDVGIDAEGCFDVTISGNVTRNCDNGGIAVFFYNRGVLISGNVCTTTVADEWLIAIYNSGTTTENKDITITGNILHAVGVVGKIGHDGAENIKISGNTLRNVRMVWDAANYAHMEVSDNQVVFDTAYGSTFSALTLWKPRAVSHRQTARGNVVISTVSQPSGSAGILAFSDDFNNSSTQTVVDNEVEGFPIDIQVSADSGNAGIVPRFIVQDNVFGAGVFSRLEGAQLKSAVQLEGNRVRSTLAPFPSDIPVSGKWDLGQRIYYADPATAGAPGAVCTVAGSPGTWKKFGGDSPQSSTTVSGLVELATTEETKTGTDTDRAVTPAGLHGAMDWTTYTPTLSNITLGDGTVTGRYMQLGKLVFLSIDFVMGSTSSMGTDPAFSLPVNSTGTRASNFSVHFDDSGSTHYMGSAALNGTQVIPRLLNTASTYGSFTGVPSATVPMTWVVNDSMRIFGYYRAA